MALDLSGVQRVAESFLLDTCTVTRGPGNPADDAFDDDTGVYTPIAPETVLSGVACGVSGKEQSSTFKGVTAPLPAGPYLLLLALAQPALRVADQVVVTASRDTALPTRTFRLEDIGEVGTYDVLRVYGMTEVTNA